MRWPGHGLEEGSWYSQRTDGDAPEKKGEARPGRNSLWGESHERETKSLGTEGVPQAVTSFLMLVLAGREVGEQK